MPNELKVGDQVPHFLLNDHRGLPVTERALKGITSVLYFYPKDETPNCTTQACSFRNEMITFDTLATLIIGISPDSIESHQHFIKNHKLDFTLLSDEKKEMCRVFGVLDGDRIIRTTFLIDADGIIKWIEKPVNVVGHSERVIAAIKEHCPKSIIKFDDYNSEYAAFLQGGFKMTESIDEIRERIKKKYNIRDSDLEDKDKKK